MLIDEWLGIVFGIEGLPLADRAQALDDGRSIGGVVGELPLAGAEAGRRVDECGWVGDLCALRQRLAVWF